MRQLWVPVLCLILAPPSIALAQSASKTEMVGQTLTRTTPQEANFCTTQAIDCGQTIAGTLDAGDCMNADGSVLDRFGFAGTNGESVTATLSSTAFTPFLELITPNGDIKTSSTGAGTAQVNLTLDATGNWVLGVTSQESGLHTGAYTLQFQCGSSTPTCFPNDTTLCVGNGRFSVRATFDAGASGSGQAHAVALTGDTGYLWFFSDTNVEAVIKVLDGCVVNHHFWVFAGGLTNVEVTMTVTDVQSQTNNVKVYKNPANTTFLPIQDVNAFATCP
jgi:hypothetical protein